MGVSEAGAVHVSKTWRARALEADIRSLESRSEGEQTASTRQCPQQTAPHDKCPHSLLTWNPNMFFECFYMKGWSSPTRTKTKTTCNANGMIASIPWFWTAFQSRSSKEPAPYLPKSRGPKRVVLVRPFLFSSMSSTSRNLVIATNSILRYSVLPRTSIIASVWTTEELLYT